MPTNVVLEEVPFAILEAVKARILRSRQASMDGREMRRSLKPRPGIREIRQGRELWRRPEVAASLFGSDGFALGPVADFANGILRPDISDFGQLAFSQQGAVGTVTFDLRGGPSNANALVFTSEPYSELRAVWDQPYTRIGDVYTMEAFVNLGPLPTGSEFQYTGTHLYFGCYQGFTVGWRIELLQGLQAVGILETYTWGTDSSILSEELGNYSIDHTVDAAVWAPSQWKHIALVRNRAAEPGYLTQALYFDGKRMSLTTTERAEFGDLDPGSYVNQDSAFWRWYVQGQTWGSTTASPRLHGFRLVKGEALYQGETITPPATITALP